jgi:iron complex outermembrane receptor protein
VASTALSITAHAQQAETPKGPQSVVPQPEARKKGEKIEDIVVTGTNIRTDVSEVAALPLTIITPDDIARQGPQELSQTLRANPAFSGGTLNGGSGGFFSGGVQTLNMLGLGDKYTLVLVDGRRFNAVTPTNIANIPAGAISSIEILKDGGSSIYGSDAVAGVVNIIMTKKYDGMEISGSYGDRIFGADFGKHATDLTTGLKIGVSSDRARFFGDIEFHKRGGTKIIDTQEGRIANLNGNQVYTDPANITLPNGNTVILNYHKFQPGQYSLNPADYIPYDQYNYNSTVGQTLRARIQDRSPEQSVTGFSYVEYDLTDKATLFSEMYYSAFRSTEQNEEWGVDFFGDAHLDYGPVPASNPWNPFGVDLAAVRYALPELGGVLSTNTIYTDRIVGGLKGEIGQFAYEIGTSYFWDDHTNNGQHYYSDAGLNTAIHRPGPDALNPFCFACNTPAQVAGIDVSQTIETVSQQAIFDAKISGPLVKRSTYDVAFAAGAETRKEKWTYSVDPLTATGDVYFLQTLPDYQERRSSAVFGELAYHIGEEAGIPAIHRLTVNLSARHEWIEKVGGTTNPHLAVSWQPIGAAVMLRGSYGTSFAAPPINLLRPTSNTINTILIYPQFGNQSLPTDVTVGGNPNLTPERAKTLNFGIIITPSQLPGSSLTVDHFYVRQRDVVLVPDPQAIVYGLFPGTVVFTQGKRPEINAVARNVGGRNVKGFNVDLNLRRPTASAGTFGFRYGAVWLTKFDVDNGPGFQAVLGTFQNYLFNYSSVGALGTLPRMRESGGPNWTSPSGTVTAQLTANHVGHYHDGFGTDRWVSQFLTYDFNLNADLSSYVHGLTVNLGILNITSAQPPYVQGFGEVYTYYDPGLSNSLGRLGFAGFKYHF